MSIIDSLKRTDLFGDWDSTHLAKVADFCRGVSFNRGTVIFKEGEEADEFYLLTNGRVVLEMDIRPVAERPVIPTAVEVVTEDEVFGWSALVEPYTYTLSARCVTHCSALAIRGDVFRRTMDYNPALGYRVMRQLARIVALRLAQTRQRLITGLGLVATEKELRTTE